MIRYVVDANVLIDFEHLFPFDVFPSLWEQLRLMTKERRFVCPRPIFDELRRDGDTGYTRRLETAGFVHIREVDTPMLEQAARVVQRCPTLVNSNNRAKSENDPFLIALASVEMEAANKQLAIDASLNDEWVVLSNERPRAGPGGRMRVPDACAEFGVRCVNRDALYQLEGWRF